MGAAGAVLGLLAGTGWQLQQAALLPGWAGWALLAVAAALAVPARRGGWVGAVACTLAGIAVGFGATELRAQARLADRLDAVLEGQDLVVTGVVSDLPRVGADGTRFLFEPEAATLRGAPVRLPALLSLGWYAGADDEAGLAGPPEALRAGQRWRLPLRLRQPHGTLNPHGFDLELWLFERGIGGNGSVRTSAGGAMKLDENAGHPIDRFRQQVRDAIARRVGDARIAGVLAALAVGDQAAIDREGWELFRTTGIAHLVSISGIHITMLAWLASALASRLWRTSPRAMLALPAPVAARWLGLAVATGYAVVAGWGVPAQRTVLMLAVVALLRSAGWRWPLHAVLLAAAGAVVAVDPWALMQPGFWLSFAAVGLLVAAGPVQAPRPGTGVRALLREGFRTQLVATIGLAPLSLVFFQQLSVVGFVANLVAIPLVTLLVTPLSLAGMLLPPLWLLAAALVKALSAFLQALAGVPWASWTAAAAPAWAVAAGLLGGALAVLPLPWRLRVLALPLVLPLLLPPVPRPAAGRFELVAADIGQGTAVLVRTREHLLVFDTGPAYTADADAGSRVLVPLLRARGERRVDLLMLSHRDADHVGGAASLLAALPVDAVSSSLTPDHPLLQRGVPHRRCEAGQRWAWDGVRFEVLHPLAADHERQAKSNALSCVLRIEGADGSALLTGDIEAAQEAALVERGVAPSELLVVPHHGSRTSSTARFIDAVQPRVAVVQAAYRSRFGHPAPDVVARYEERRITVVRSDRCGAFAWPQSTCERQLRKRYWHHRFEEESPR